MLQDRERRPAPGKRWIRIPLLAGVAVAVSVPLCAWATAAWADLRALADSPTATPADAIADLAAVLALAAWAWLLLGAVVTIVETSARQRRPGLAAHIAPAAWRRAVLTAVGIGMLTAPGAVAHASPGEDPHTVAASDPGSSAATSAAQAVRGLPLPDRPYGRLTLITSGPVERPGDRSRAEVERHIVRSGDSLWAIAKEHLGPQATVQAIALEWRRWYAVNRACIGPDPNLIIPGMVLHPPETKAAS